ncbi:MAG: methylenetetrahydrofolate reductase [NAD(P)H] [Candidatus Eremiobacteraeota bacterium]|nr:methylenetetrahydrofolate reductase [NAD(P)H] [Candidatus Eremiobacteraeota bacterium]
MRIIELLQDRRPFFSFEFFPPRTDEAHAQLLETVDTLRTLRPAFVSVTYGAGGSTRARTVEISKQIRNDLGLNVMAHLTCSGSSRSQLREVLGEIEEAGIENVLALRGDPPKSAERFERPVGGFAYASELTGMLARNYRFCVGGACYPEKHIEASDMETDLRNLRAKVDAGAEFLITQLFFDNDRYVSFVERARAMGITVPILPGIMPITNYEQIQRFTAMCGATIPPKLRVELEERRDQPKAVEDLGVAYATLQCADLLRRGAPGIHFYTLNKSPATRAIVSSLVAATAWRPSFATTR